MFNFLPVKRADFDRSSKWALDTSGKQWLTAYADADEDESVWPAESGLIHAEVNDARQAQKLLDLTDEEREQLKVDGTLYKDIDGKTYQIDLY